MLRHRIGEHVRGEISFRLAAIVDDTDRGITPEDFDISRTFLSRSNGHGTLTGPTDR